MSEGVMSGRPLNAALGVKDLLNYTPIRVYTESIDFSACLKFT